MTGLKKVKVDNWGIYFLQRLKHFFNRTDYCDLTLQFQDNAQLKVHRLVLNACTEYFELLERTCEMYEDCLIMPDDLQADVVVPIVNFMYTGQLEFRPELLERLYQTSQVMNMSVLTKLLDVQRVQPPNINKQSYGRTPVKRPYGRAFESVKPGKKIYIPPKKPAIVSSPKIEKPKYLPSEENTIYVPRKPANVPRTILAEPKPTRYEVPEELDALAACDSFSSISYDSKPLMVHPETSKRYDNSKSSSFGIFSDASGSRTLDVECRKITHNDSVFDDTIDQDDSTQLKPKVRPIEKATRKNSSALFDQVFDQGHQGSPKVTIETNNSIQAANIDHAKIISEVLKKYPHLVNSNKSIKLKVLDTPPKTERRTMVKKRPVNQLEQTPKIIMPVIKKEEEEESETTYQEVLDSKEAAKLIAMGAENTQGPWICLICGTPGTALHFSKYYTFRKHLVEVHNEKPILNICEYCGLKSAKRNYLLYHLYTKHNVQPPPSYHFPKCTQCPYIAINENFLNKHKATHVEPRSLRCNVCASTFKSSQLLLRHIQLTGHKYGSEKKQNLQCVYCMRAFSRESNLCAHLKSCHKTESKEDGIIEDSDEEDSRGNLQEMQENNYQIQMGNYSDIQITRTQQIKKKILNAEFNMQSQHENSKMHVSQLQDDFEESIPSPIDSNYNEEITCDQSYNQESKTSQEYYVPLIDNSETVNMVESSAIHFTDEDQIQNVPKNKTFKGQSIEIVVANEESMMSHQQPILFGSDENNGKTLAVLTTLDSTQDNNMIVLPDVSSALNVSEVDTKNSNIVVIYSHPVGDSNKQFIMSPQFAQTQILSSQAIGTHYIQSPAILTQNIGTIVTSAQNIPEHVVMTQTLQSTPKDLPHVVESQTEISTNASQSNLIEISELRMIQPANETESKMIDDNTNQMEVSLSNEQVVVTTGTVSTISPGTYIDNNACLIENTAITEHTEVVFENMPQSIDHSDVGNELNDTLTSEPEKSQSHELDNSITEQVLQTSEEQQSSIPSSDENNEIENENSILQNKPLVKIKTIEEKVTEEVVDHPSENQSETVVESTKQIETIASEWSEEEEENVATNSSSAKVSNINEAEESIENIQHEVNKHISEESSVNETHTVITENDIKETNGTEIKTDTVVAVVEIENGEKAQNKITTLLNDWDENDSQENDDENDSQKNDDEKKQEEIINQEDNENQAIEPSEPKISANIKSLVQDWDEGEEEKEQIEN